MGERLLSSISVLAGVTFHRLGHGGMVGQGGERMCVVMTSPCTVGE